MQWKQFILLPVLWVLVAGKSHALSIYEDGNANQATGMNNEPDIPIVGPLDRNNDGFISPAEIDQALSEIARSIKALRLFLLFVCWFPGSEVIKAIENLTSDIAFVPKDGLLGYDDIYALEQILSQVVDINHDGLISPEEIAILRNLLIQVGCAQWIIDLLTKRAEDLSQLYQNILWLLSDWEQHLHELGLMGDRVPA